MALTDLTLNTNSICNLALSHLGQKPITDLTTDVAANNPSALALNTHWGPVRNDLFSEFKWPFANVIQPLQVQTGVDVYDYPEWLYFYVYTANAATVWWVFDQSSSSIEQKQKNEFEVVYNPSLDKRIICCNITNNPAAYNEYTYNVVDPTMWSPKFVMAFSYRLAASMAQVLTGSDTLGKELAIIANGVIHEAKRISNYEKKKKPKQDNPILDARG